MCFVKTFLCRRLGEIRGVGHMGLIGPMGPIGAPWFLKNSDEDIDILYWRV